MTTELTRDEVVDDRKPSKPGMVELDPMEILLDVPARQNITEEVNITRRDKKFKVKIRAIGGEEYRNIQDQCTTRIVDRKRGGLRTEFDQRKSQRLVILNCVSEPNLRDKKLLDAYNVRPEDEDAIVDRAFLPGEVDYLAECILELSGYTEEVLEKVKA